MAKHISAISSRNQWVNLRPRTSRCDARAEDLALLFEYVSIHQLRCLEVSKPLLVEIGMAAAIAIAAKMFMRMTRKRMAALGC